jgi:hypothetical protein
MSHPNIRTSQDFAAQPFSAARSCTVAERHAGEQAQPDVHGKRQSGPTLEFLVLLLSIAAGADAGHAS